MSEVVDAIDRLIMTVGVGITFIVIALAMLSVQISHTIDRVAAIFQEKGAKLEEDANNKG